MQQHERNEKVAKLQDEAESITAIIQHIHQKVCKEAESLENITPEHVTSNLVEMLNKTEEYV